MSKAIAFARSTALNADELARSAVVLASALVLIAAGQVLPF